MFIVAWSCVSFARADVVELGGGREMKGLITRETAEELDLDIGYGSVTLKKADITAIKRSAPKNRQALLKAKRLKQLEEGDSAPEAGAPLLASYRKAAQARDDLRDARARGAEVEEADSGSDSGLAELISDNKKIAQDLSTADRNADPAYYNRLVGEFNSGTAAIRAKQLALEERRNAHTGTLDKSRDYLVAYQDFQRECRAYPAPEKAASADDKEFFALMRDALAGMDRDFSQEKVDAERRGSHWIVTALLDGRVKARLLVDTGASMVVISRAIADQLGPEAVKRGAAQISLADGRKVPTDVLELPSVEVGRNRADRVFTSVMPDAPSDGIDGLLGMTFLNRFGFESDPKSGVFYLRRLK
jgi:clan AA aspartic protease (TIGR02281 family)